MGRKNRQSKEEYWEKEADASENNDGEKEAEVVKQKKASEADDMAPTKPAKKAEALSDEEQTSKPAASTKKAQRKAKRKQVDLDLEEDEQSTTKPAAHKRTAEDEETPTSPARSTKAAKKSAAKKWAEESDDEEKTQKPVSPSTTKKSAEDESDEESTPKTAKSNKKAAQNPHIREAGDEGTRPKVPAKKQTRESDVEEEVSSKVKPAKQKRDSQAVKKPAAKKWAEEESDKEDPKPKPAKKPSPKQSTARQWAAEESDEGEEEAIAKPLTKSKKAERKAKRKQIDLEDTELTKEMPVASPTEEPAKKPAEEPTEAKQPAQPAKSSKKAQRKEKRKGGDLDVDIDALVAEIEKKPEPKGGNKKDSEPSEKKATTATPTAVATPAPTTTVAAPTAASPAQQPATPVESTPPGEPAEGESGKKKKKKKKGAAEEPKKKKTPGAALAKMMAKMKEEEERRAREEEERRKREEEERKQREEEERKAEEERKRLAEIAKKEAQEKKRLQKLAEEEKRRQQAIARLGITVPPPAAATTTAAEPEKKKRPMFKKKRPAKKRADSDDDSAGSAKPTATTTAESTAPEGSAGAAATEASEEASWESMAEAEAAAPADSTASSSLASSMDSLRSTESAASASSSSSNTSMAQHAHAEPAKQPKLRSPIVVVLGHVDAGKTSLLDKIRNTNVQKGEAGGITQQIGATFFPMDAIREVTSRVSQYKIQYKVPGLLIMDTPGHESFTNLRSRGSSLCDIAVLVVNFMKGIQPQTIESINLLRKRRTNFIVAMNQVDRIYGWKSTPFNPIQTSLAQQTQDAVVEFNQRTNEIIAQFAEQKFNAALYWKNPDFRTTVSLVPTSAATGEGIPDLLLLLTQITQRMMSDRLLELASLQCSILEVKVVEGLGTTIDVILSNGELHEGDRIVVCGLDGPIVTTIRALLTPPPMREIRVKTEYVRHKTVRAALGVKIAAHDLERAVAGSHLMVVHPGDDIEKLKDEVQADLESLKAHLDKSGRGVYVQASTLGSLEALLDFLKSVKVPVANFNIGPVHKKDVIRASVMHDHKAPEFAVILAFDVKIAPEAQDAAAKLGVTIFCEDVIYRLFDLVTKYMEDVKERRKREVQAEAVWPVHLQIIPEYIIKTRDPIIVGVRVIAGKLKLGTPVAAVRELSAKEAAAAAAASTAARAKAKREKRERRDMPSDSEESEPEEELETIDNKEREREAHKADKAAAAAAAAGRTDIVSLGRVTSIESNHRSVQEAKAGDEVSIKIEHKPGDTPKLLGRHFEVKDPIYSVLTRPSIDALKLFYENDLSEDDAKLIMKLKKVFDIM